MENSDRTKISKALRKKRNERFYEKRKNDRIFCECCKRHIDKYYWTGHINTRLHKRCQEIADESKH